jgi:hypothetical protein
MADFSNTQNAFENLVLNDPIPVDIKNTVTPIIGEIRRDRSFVVVQAEDPEPIDPWNPSISSTPKPFLWGLPSEIVVVKMDDPAGYKGWSKYRSLAMSRYLTPFIRRDPNIVILDSLFATCLTPAFFKVSEEERSGFAGYGELKQKASNQFIYWLNEVRKPHFEENFVDLANLSLRTLPENPDWFQELKNIKFDPIIYHADISYSLYPQSNSIKAKELLAAFAFLEIGILEEDIPYKNFLWACETLQCTTSEQAGTFIHSFLSQLPLLRMWMKNNTAAFVFNQDLHEYEILHDRITRLHNKIEHLKEDSFDTSSGISKRLRRRFKSCLKRNTFKLAKSEVKAKNLVLKIRPLIEKKLKFDEEERIRMKEKEFFNFSWARFHALVTWSFPHYFQVISTPTTA